MIQGLGILLVVFAVVGVLHWLSQKSLQLTPEQKKRARLFFWYVYGIFTLFSGAIRIFEKGVFEWFQGLQCLFGILIIGLNYWGKIHPAEEV